MSTIVTRAVFLIGLSALLAAAPAQAEPEVPSVAVRTVDLDLGTAAGERALNMRIAHAVRSVCGDADIRDLEAIRKQDACRTAAMAKAAPKIQVAIANGRAHKAYAANSANGAPPATRE